LLGDVDEVCPDDETYVDNSGISQPRIFENKGANKGEIDIRCSQLAVEAMSDVTPDADRR